MNRWLSIIFLSLLLLSPTTLLADDTNTATGSALSLAPPDTDQSQGFLYSLFGTVDGVIHPFLSNGFDSSGILVGQMFGLFNSAVLFLGGILVFYTLIVSTLNTAHEGEVMGRNWSSIWIPMRSALGIAFMLPKASGFNLMQIFMMWVIVQGIGAADSLWNVILDTVESNVAVLAPPALPVSDPMTPAAAILTGQVCMKAWNIYQQTHDKSAKTIISYRTYGPSKHGLMKKGYFSDEGDNCGQITWQQSPNMDIESAVERGIDAMDQKTEVLSDTIIATGDSNELPANALIEVSEAYQTSVSEAVSSTQQIGSGHLNTSFIDDAKRDGWSSAGRYYYDISKLTNAVQQVVPVLNPEGPDEDSASNEHAIDAVSHYMPTTAAYIGAERDSYTQTNSANFDFGEVSDKHGREIYQVFSWGLINIMNEWSAMFKKQADGNTNPIVALHGFGLDVLAQVQDIWFGIESVIVSMTAVKMTGVLVGFLPRVGAAAKETMIQIADMVGDILSWWTPLLTISMGFLLMAGSALGIYLPMLPFILFYFGVMGWLMGVIEAIIAGPVVALGVLSPEGHQIAGKAAPAMLILVNAFLRPSLMLFGLVFALMLGYVGLGVLNAGFTVFEESIFSDKIGMFEAIALVVIYSGIALMMLQNCFSLIHVVPDRLMRWIGIHETFGGGEEKAEGGVRGMAGQAQQAHGKAHDRTLTPAPMKIPPSVKTSDAPPPPKADAASGSIDLHH